ncbi:hypothetical protein MJO29_015516 [Puccinia striiformis f. sp. tritici]|nr:hypothetical protein MJO29_015516 [Puccinia striiformis f. sp. tritici]
MFSTTRSSDPPGTSPLMFKDDLQGVVRSIRGIPNELVTGDVTNHHRSTKISLCSPLFQRKHDLNLREGMVEPQNGIARRSMERNAWGQRRCQSVGELRAHIELRTTPRKPTTYSGNSRRWDENRYDSQFP